MRRILLAEDHGPTREFVSRTLADAGFDVATAAGATDAYERYASHRPVAVVLAADLADGAAALARRLRDADPRALLVVIDKEHLGKARGVQAILGVKADGYVADPTRRELVEKLQQLVQQRTPAAEGAPRGTALVLSRAPSGRGEVVPGAVARVLHQLWRALSEGILVLEEGARERRLFFLRGIPVAFESADAGDGLVAWLGAQGRLDPAHRTAALEAMASGLSAGAALIAAGVVEPGEPLRAALRAHVGAMVARAVGARDGRWRFHPGTEFAGEVHPVQVEPLQAILEGARAGIAAKHLAEALRPAMDAYPARTAELQQLLPGCGLSSQDLRLALSLDGRETTRAWLQGRERELQRALSLLWFLALVSAVSFQDEAAAADACGKAAPRRKKPLPPDRAEAIRQAALRILPGTHFHALGVDLAADAAEVERAYAEVASRFHPDAFAEYDMGDLADLLAAVQDKLAAAHRVLASEERRRAYAAYLLPRLEPDGARRAALDLDAEIALRKGERALRARRNAEAVDALRRAVERNPREPEYHAMLGFAALFDPVQPRRQRAEEARRHARKAQALEADHPRAAAVLALAEEALGDVVEARRAVLAGLRAHPASEVLKRVLHRVNRTRA